MCLNIFIVSRTTKTQVDNDNKTTVTRWHDTKLAAITLVRSWGHLIGATRSHDLQKAILADQGAPADHSKILARRTNVIMSVQLNSVGRAHPPIVHNSFNICCHNKKSDFAKRFIAISSFQCMYIGIGTHYEQTVGISSTRDPMVSCPYSPDP